MPLDAFTTALGVHQGRVARATGHVFVLGDDASATAAELNPGDFAEVVQDIDVTDAHFIRAQLRLRTPPDPGGMWAVSLLVDNVEVAAAFGYPGRTRDVTDLAANVSKLSGVHEFAVRLELVALDA